MVYIICIVYQNHYKDRSHDVVGPWSNGDCRKGKPDNNLYTPTFCSMFAVDHMVSRAKSKWHKFKKSRNWH